MPEAFPTILEELEKATSTLVEWLREKIVSLAAQAAEEAGHPERAQELARALALQIHLALVHDPQDGPFVFSPRLVPAWVRGTQNPREGSGSPAR